MIDKRKYLLDNYYGVSMTICDLDKLYDSQSEVIVINDLVTGTSEKEQQEAAMKFSRLIKTEISGTNFVSTPKCFCGNLHTQYDCDVGTVCKVCHTLCIKAMHQPIRERCWLRAIYPTKGFIHPTLWVNFINAFSTYMLTKTNPIKGYDLLAWMCDPNYRPGTEPSAANVKVQRYLLDVIGFKRGLNNFIESFDWLMDKLLDPEVFYRIRVTFLNKKGGNAVKDLHAKVEEDRQDWLEFIRQHRSKFFPMHIPMISDQLIITEESNDEKQIDNIYLGMIDCAKSILSAYSHQNKKNKERVIVSRMVNANRQHALFNLEYRRDILFPKAGIIRSKNNRTRSSYSGRATITAIPHGHDYDTCHAPWRWLVNLLYLDISNKLIHQHGFTPVETIRLIDLALVSYEPVIHQVIKDLIEESPGKGIMVLPLRNPTLVRLSVWVMYITDVKIDVNDGSISISNLVIKQANADKRGMCNITIVRLG